MSLHKRESASFVFPPQKFKYLHDEETGFESLYAVIETEIEKEKRKKQMESESVDS